MNVHDRTESQPSERQQAPNRPEYANHCAVDPGRPSTVFDGVAGLRCHKPHRPGAKRTRGRLLGMMSEPLS